MTWYWQLPANAASADSATPDSLAHWGEFTVDRWNQGEACHSNIVHSNDDQPEGWRCHGYGERTTGSVLTCHEKIDGAALILTYVGRASRPAMQVDLHRLKVGSLHSAPDIELTTWQHGPCQWTMPIDSRKSLVTEDTTRG